MLGPDGDQLYAVDEADPYDPTGRDPSEELYAVRDGRLHTRDGNELAPVAGPLGDGSTPVSAATVNLDGSRAAGVSPEGGDLVVADLAASTARRRRRRGRGWRREPRSCPPSRPTSC